MTDEWFEENYGEWLALMSEDQGNNPEPYTPEDLEELYYQRRKSDEDIS